MSDEQETASLKDLQVPSFDEDDDDSNIQEETSASNIQLNISYDKSEASTALPVNASVDSGELLRNWSHDQNNNDIKANLSNLEKESLVSNDRDITSDRNISYDASDESNALDDGISLPSKSTTEVKTDVVVSNLPPLAPTLEVKETPMTPVAKETIDNALPTTQHNQVFVPRNNIPTDFPAIEVTVDSSSCMSVGDYEDDMSNFTPMSPLTPADTSRKKLSKHARTQSEADHLMNVLQKINQKQKDYNDIDMGMSSTPKAKSKLEKRSLKHPFHMKMEDDSSSSSSSEDTTLKKNRPVRFIDQETHNGILKPPKSHARQTSIGRYKKHSKQMTPLSPISMASSYQKQVYYSEFPQPPLFKKKKKDPTLHAQTFVLALAFLAIWSPQNLMAPNLTQMAVYFHFNPDQRDLYLGANIAFATGVLSLPVQTMLGFLADVVPSRKKLFAYTVLCGGLAAIGTGYSQTYTQLYFCRFVCGGCMSGSVPIAFSMLGDFFEPKDRNAASSGLTAMMGAGILFGQVGAGMIGDTVGWKRPFYISGTLSIITSLMVLYFVREPVRGGKEKVLQEMIANGKKYDRKLTAAGFINAMTKNNTNIILMLQSFTTSVPWGIIFTFLNDYFTQEKGMSVAASTILIVWFGLGCAAGGIIGGAIGTKCIKINRSFLPLFMAVSTILGIVPFLGLLDLELNGASVLAIFLAFTGPCVANLPSVNVRPCILNVNPPESRGAAMTAANLMVNVARGAGPSIVTLSQGYFGATRQESFNISLIIFWTLTTLLLLVLAKTLPDDQDSMETELERYAASMIAGNKGPVAGVANDGQQGEGTTNGGVAEENHLLEDMSEAGKHSHVSNFDEMTIYGNESIISIEDRLTSFDASALQESWTFIGGALREIAEAGHILEHVSSGEDEDSSDEEDEENVQRETDPLLAKT